MNIQIVRDRLETDDPTTGQLTAGDLKMLTLEPPWKSNQRGVSCIPPGIYKITHSYSPKFQRNMPHLQDVPDRTEIMIHPLNWVFQTHGCIGVGYKFKDDMLQDSRHAFADLEAWLMSELLMAGPVFVEVSYAE